MQAGNSIVRSIHFGIASPNADRHRYEIKIHPAKPLIQPDLALVSAQPAHGRLPPCEGGSRRLSRPHRRLRQKI
jgi:hypothetical protein